MRLPLNGNPPITNPFGVPDSNAAFGFHAGVDYGVPTGTPVYACIAGTVSIVQNDQYHGNVVDIHNGDKWYRVMHLQKFVKTSGTVKEGDLIAYSNNTGLSTGPHLHWDVRTQYIPTSFAVFINPLTLLKEEPEVKWDAGNTYNIIWELIDKEHAEEAKRRGFWHELVGADPKTAAFTIIRDPIFQEWLAGKRATPTKENVLQYIPSHLT